MWRGRLFCAYGRNPTPATKGEEEHGRRKIVAPHVLPNFHHVAVVWPETRQWLAVSLCASQVLIAARYSRHGACSENSQ